MNTGPRGDGVFLITAKWEQVNYLFKKFPNAYSEHAKLPGNQRTRASFTVKSSTTSQYFIIVTRRWKQVVDLEQKIVLK